jgi:soluble lytic murein transglycosylase-like protein
MVKVKLLTALLLLGALCGCSGGGWLPNGPHTMDSALLHRIVIAQARDNGLAPQLVSAMIEVESHGDPAAVSRAGAQGLMQLMPDTAATYGVLNAFDPYENVSGGCRYMHDLLRRYHNNVSLALAAYNAGPGAVDGAGGVPSFPETRAYVTRVVAELRSTTN